MACSIAELLEAAKCLQCNLMPGQVPYAQLAALCNITDPTEFSTALLQVGTDGSTPANLTVDPNASAPFILTRHVADNAPAILRIQKKGTTGNINGAVSVNDNLARLDFYAWDGASFNAGSVFQLTANENWTTTARGSRISCTVVANGATATTEVLRMTTVSIDAMNGAVFAVAGTQVVSARNTGWVTFIGTANKNAGALDTGTVTTPQLAQVVKSILDALIAHGLLGT
jgi:hypothetical protein